MRYRGFGGSPLPLLACAGIQWLVTRRAEHWRDGGGEHRTQYRRGVFVDWLGVPMRVVVLLLSAAYQTRYATRSGYPKEPNGNPVRHTSTG